METLLILTAVLLVAFAFHWLRRQLGDEWPPPPPPEIPVEVVTSSEAAAPAETTLSGPDLTPATAIPAYDETRVSEPIAVTISQAASGTATAEIAAEPRPLPPPDDVIPVTAEEPAPPSLNPTAWVLVAGGGLLAVLSQFVTRVMPAGERLPAFGLTMLGGIALLVGVQSFMRGALPSWACRPLARLAAWLSVTPAQVILLLLAPAFALLARQAAGDGLLARQAAVSVLAWLLAISFAVAGSASRETRRPLNIDRWDVALSVLLFVAAFVLRAYKTTVFPDTYSGDEGSAGLFAVELLTGKANNLFGLGWFSFPSLYFTVQSAAIALFGQTVEAVRLTSAVAGALTVTALYWLGRSMFDRTTAILAASYLAVSHFHIHMSRIALNNVWDGLFGTVAILGLWHGWQSGRCLSFIICGLALGLGQYFYVSIRILPILFLIWAAVAFWRQREHFRERFAGLALAAFIALIVFLPLGLFFAAHPDEFQAPMNRVTIFGDWLEMELAKGERTTVDILLDQAIMGVMGFTHEPLRLLYNPGSPLLLAGAAFLFLLGILWALLNFDLRYLLLLLPLLGAVAANTVSQDTPASQRYIMAMPMVAIFVALPLAQAIAWLRAQYPRTRVAVTVAGFVLMALVAAIDLDYYFNRVYDNYVLGGGNTETATHVAYYLRDKEPAGEQVFFFGFPRMGYFSHSTIPFLAPEKRGQDIVEPLTGPPDIALDGPALFIFLPERLNELEFVRQRYPGGDYREFFSDDGVLLFVVYET